MANKLITKGVDSSVLVKNLNSEYLNGTKLDNILSTGCHNFANGCLVELDIKKVSNRHLVIHITGNTYNELKPIDTIIQASTFFRNNSPEWIRVGGYNNGFNLKYINLFFYNESYYIWIPPLPTSVARESSGLNVNVYSIETNQKSVNLVKSVIKSDMITDGVEALVSVYPKVAVHNETGSAFDIVDLPTTVSTLDLDTLPPIANVNTIILRYNGVVQDLDTYVSQVETPAIMPLPMSEGIEVNADIPSTLELNSDIAPMVNLDDYVGTPNNWLKIYVPNTQLSAYKETYPKLCLYFYSINDLNPNNIEVGSVNLLNGTKTFKNVEYIYTNVTENNKKNIIFDYNQTYKGLTVATVNNNNPSTAIFDIVIPCEYNIGDIYTLSFYSKGTAMSILTTKSYIFSNSANFNLFKEVSDGRVNFKFDEKWKRYYMTFKVTATDNNRTAIRLRASGTESFSICGIKLERGTVATDWSPTPEDIDAQFEETDDKIEEVKETYAKKDGAYEGLLAGTALNLQGQQDIPISSMCQPTGGNLDVSWTSAEIQNIKGNSIVWNQLVKNGNFEDESNWKLYTEDTSEIKGTYEVSNNKAILERTGESGYSWIAQSLKESLIIGHTYIIRGDYMCLNENSTCTIQVICNGKQLATTRSKYYDEWTTYQGIFTVNALDYISDRIAVTFNGLVHIRNIQLFDLSLIYGLGNEPTTINQFNDDYVRWFGKHIFYENTDVGSIRNVKATGIKTEGFNLYKFNDFDGDLTQWIHNFPNENYIWENIYNYKGQIQITGNYKLTLNNELNDEFIFRIIYKDASYEWVKLQISNSEFNVISNNKKEVERIESCYSTDGPKRFLKLTNFCIHFVWSGSRNDEYEEHWEETKSLPLTSLKGKLDGEGESIVVFPDGLKSAKGEDYKSNPTEIHDEIVIENGITKAIKRIGSIVLNQENMGMFDNDHIFRFPLPNALFVTSRWNNCHFLNALPYKYHSINTGIYGYKMQGTTAGYLAIADDDINSTEEFFAKYPDYICYYQLAEPEVYILDDFQLPLVYKIDDFGTEEIISPENSVTPIMTTRYGVNAVDTLRRLPQNYISEKSINNLLNQLNTLMDGTWTKSWNNTSNSYDFSFVPNEVPDSSLPNEELP